MQWQIADTLGLVYSKIWNKTFEWKTEKKKDGECGKKQQGAMKSSFKYKMETEAHVAQPFPAEVSLKEETVRLEIWCSHQVQVVIGLIQGMSKYQTNSV